MNNELSLLQSRFGDRYPGMELVTLESLCWPVFRHTLKVIVREEVSLDPLEEGLLRLVLAGVQDSNELAHLLGCSESYARTMGGILSRATGYQMGVPLACVGGKWMPTSATAEVIRTCERPTVAERTLTLYRDAVFGSWMNHERRFRVLAPGDTDDPPSRWLGPAVLQSAEQDGVIEDVLQDMERTSQEEILDADLSDGSLQWLHLKLACYQSTDFRTGRFLLFNSVEENEPLPDISTDFERLLASSHSPQLYFPDDAAGTGASFWNSLSSRIRVLDRTQELVAKQEHFEQIRSAFETHLHQNAETLPSQEDNAVPSVPVPAVDIGSEKVADSPDQPLATEATGTTSGSTSQEAAARMEGELRRYETELDDLRRALANAPVTRHLETKDHPPLLKEAFQSAQNTIVLISPWIKMRILRPLLPQLDDALRRGCEVWIGYGMPPSTTHKDNSDPDAITALKQRESKGLRLVDMWTHEKVLVVDDELYVNTSFNWLSYSGGDGRRESGLLQRGGVRPFRERFLADLQLRSKNVAPTAVAAVAQAH